MRQVANRRETAGTNADVTQTLAVLINDGAALEDQIVAASHAGLRQRLEMCFTALTFRRDFWQETIARHPRDLACRQPFFPSVVWSRSPARTPDAFLMGS